MRQQWQLGLLGFAITLTMTQVHPLLTQHNPHNLPVSSDCSPPGSSALESPRPSWTNPLSIPLGTLPLPLANAVMQDVQERFRVSTLHCDYPAITDADIQLQLDSVEAVTWNLCRGGAGPTQQAMGICPDGTLSGWRMIVLGKLREESWQLVYYILQDAQPTIWMAEPDGVQSFPASVKEAVLHRVAQQSNLSATQLQLHWVDSRVFDGCLLDLDQPQCPGATRLGWRVELLVNTPTSMGEQALWVYHTNLAGTQVRRVSQGIWSPPP